MDPQGPQSSRLQSPCVASESELGAHDLDSLFRTAASSPVPIAVDDDDSTRALTTDTYNLTGNGEQPTTEIDISDEEGSHMMSPLAPNSTLLTGQPFFGIPNLFGRWRHLESSPSSPESPSTISRSSTPKSSSDHQVVNTCDTFCDF